MCNVLLTYICRQLIIYTYTLSRGWTLIVSKPPKPVPLGISRTFSYRLHLDTLVVTTVVGFTVEIPHMCCMYICKYQPINVFMCVSISISWLFLKFAFVVYRAMQMCFTFFPLSLASRKKNTTCIYFIALDIVFCIVVLN